MTRLVHAADLHLEQAEPEYGFIVLEEILAVVNREKAELLVFAGDLFDSFADMDKLRGRVRSALESLHPSCAVLLLPGNHEHLRAGRPAAEAMRAMSFGKVTLAAAEPWSLVELGGVELLAIPHQARYAGYTAWALPARRPGTPRIVAAHAALTGSSYLGPETEEAGSVMDVDLLGRAGAAYAAMGHLHGAKTFTVGATTVCYPGSARVWRRGETGPRGVSLVELGEGSARASPVPLVSAGEYRRAAIPLDLRGHVEDLDGLASSWGPRDLVELELFGLVEDEHAAEHTRERIVELYRGRVRHLEVRMDGVSSVAGIARNPLAARFLSSWTEREAELVALRGREVYERALRVGLAKIKASLDARGAVRP